MSTTPQFVAGSIRQHFGYPFFSYSSDSICISVHIKPSVSLSLYSSSLFRADPTPFLLSGRSQSLEGVFRRALIIQFTLDPTRWLAHVSRLYDTSDFYIRSLGLPAPINVSVISACKTRDMQTPPYRYTQPASVYKSGSGVECDKTSTHEGGQRHADQDNSVAAYNVISYGVLLGRKDPKDDTLSKTLAALNELWNSRHSSVDGSEYGGKRLSVKENYMHRGQLEMP